MFVSAHACACVCVSAPFQLLSSFPLNFLLRHFETKQCFLLISKVCIHDSSHFICPVPTLSLSGSSSKPFEEEFSALSLKFLLPNLLIGGNRAPPASTPAGEQDSSSSSTGGQKSNAKKDAKAARKLQQEAEAAAAAASKTIDKILTPEDIGVAPFGTYPRVQSRSRTNRVWTEVKDLTPEKEGQEVLIRARVYTSRAKGKTCFLLFRQGMYSVQGGLFVGENGATKDIVTFAGSIPKESIVDVAAIVRNSPSPIQSATQSLIELAILRVYVVSKATIMMPLLVADASQPEPAEDAPPVVVEFLQCVYYPNLLSTNTQDGKEIIRVNPDVRLDHRVLDLRVLFVMLSSLFPFPQCTFRSLLTLASSESNTESGSCSENFSLPRVSWKFIPRN